MEEQLDCDFFFGESPTTVKQLDLGLFKTARRTPLIPIGDGYWYRMPLVVRETKNYEIIIDDMGILCLSSWLLLLVSKIRRQKVYLWSHGWYGREGIVKKWMKRAYSALASGMFIYGNYAKDLMIANGFNSNKLYVIHNSLDYDHQLEVRHKIKETNIFRDHFGNDNPVIIFIGRLTKVKKLDILLDAISILKGKGEFYNLLLVGEGETREELEYQVIENDLVTQTWFYGECYDEGVNAELIYNSSVCVAPGNVGLTAMHTMMFGCPVISHNDFKWQMPEFEAIKSGTTGDFFTKDNCNSLAETISGWFLAHQRNREDVRKACYQEIDSNWNPHRQIELIKTVIGK